MKFAMDDARQRQKALLDLILSTDRQAMSFLGYCITIAVAAGAGSVASFGTSASLPYGAGPALLVIAIGFFISALQCVRVMQMTPVALPGRKPDFWKWAISHKIEAVEIADQYLSEMDKHYTKNSQVNGAMAVKLHGARSIGLVSCVAAAVVAALSEMHGRGLIY